MNSGGSTSIPSSNDTMNLVVKVEVNSIIDIEKIHVKVGTSLGGIDIGTHAFIFDMTSNLPTDYSYGRDEGTFKFIMGKFINPITVHYTEVIIEDVNGNLSIPKIYQSN